MDLLSVIRMAAERGASDLHLVVGDKPQIRLDGVMCPLEDIPPLTQEYLEDSLGQITSEQEQIDFKNHHELDFGYSIPGLGRVRGNAARQRGTLSFVFRMLPSTVPDIDELGLPKVCKELVMKRRGFLVVSGPTGSGKSTTLTAMINYLNAREHRRIVTIEDPVEYMYTNINCIITQRELGSDTTSFSEALRHVLRQDPDIILVGEMRDAETALAALTIAETGHLVMTTGHAPSAPQAVERIIDLFPSDERSTVQSRLASLLIGILCQTLIPRADGKGRIAAVEVMLANPAVRNTIREGKIHQLPNVMLTHSQSGMISLDRLLIDFYKKGLISRESVFSYCNDPEEILKNLGKSADVNAF